VIQGEFSSVQKSRPGGLVTRPSSGSRLWFSATCAAFLYSPNRKLMQSMEPYGREFEGSWRYFDQIFQSLCLPFPLPTAWRESICSAI